VVDHRQALTSHRHSVVRHRIIIVQSQLCDYVTNYLIGSDLANGRDERIQHRTNARRTIASHQNAHHMLAQRITERSRTDGEARAVQEPFLYPEPTLGLLVE